MFPLGLYCIECGLLGWCFEFWVVLIAYVFGFLNLGDCLAVGLLRVFI